MHDRIPNYRQAVTYFDIESYKVKRYNIKMQKRLHAFFSGSVQGVGFRFTAERIARKFPITGFVKNLPNGGVELVAEGEEESLKEFLAAVCEAFHSYIRDVEVTWSKAAGEFKSFGIQF